MRINSKSQSCYFKSPTIELCNHGLNIKKPVSIITKCKHLYNHEWKRGKITTFSRSSARLLREKLVRMPSSKQGYCTYGVTLTLPKDAYFTIDDDFINYFSKFWHNFKQRLRDNARKNKFSDELIVVWRIELTKNRVPHFHLIVYTMDKRDVSFICDLWIKALSKYYNIVPIRNVACKIQEISNFEGAYKYICSHASKHKKEQLGWQGKQWGIFFPKKIAKNILTNAMTYDMLQLNQVAECKLCDFAILSFGSYFKVLRVLRKLYNNRFLASLKTHFLVNDTREKIMRYAME